jgi:hypothetical protein
MTTPGAGTLTSTDNHLAWVQPLESSPSSGVLGAHRGRLHAGISTSGVRGVQASYQHAVLHPDTVWQVLC